MAWYGECVELDLLSVGIRYGYQVSLHDEEFVLMVRYCWMNPDPKRNHCAAPEEVC